MIEISKWEYDLIKDGIQLQELKLVKTTMLKEYLKLNKPSLYLINTRKKWNLKIKDLEKKEEEILDLLHILYGELEDLIQEKE